MISPPPQAQQEGNDRKGGADHSDGTITDRSEHKAAPQAPDGRYQPQEKIVKTLHT